MKKLKQNRPIKTVVIKNFKAKKSLQSSLHSPYVYLVSVDKENQERFEESKTKGNFRRSKSIKVIEYKYLFDLRKEVFLVVIDGNLKILNAVTGISSHLH